jgi:hypothetical protein
MRILGAFGWFSTSESHDVAMPWNPPPVFFSFASLPLRLWESPSLSESYALFLEFLARLFSARLRCTRFSTLLLYGFTKSLFLDGELNSFVNKLFRFFGLLVRSRGSSCICTALDGEPPILDRAFRCWICSGVASLSASGVSPAKKPPGPRLKLFSSGVSSPEVKSKAGARLGVLNAAMSIALLGGAGNGLSGEDGRREKSVVWPAAGRSLGICAVDIDFAGELSKSDLVPVHTSRR